MGFTRYWYIDENLLEFPKDAIKEIDAVFKRHAHLIREEWNTDNPPILTESLIMFNGIGEDGGHETFYIELPMEKKPYMTVDKKNQGKVFGFCKTAVKPYDIVVKEVLIILKEHLGNKINVSSDGDN